MKKCERAKGKIGVLHKKSEPHLGKSPLPLENFFAIYIFTTVAFYGKMTYMRIEPFKTILKKE